MIIYDDFMYVSRYCDFNELVGPSIQKIIQSLATKTKGFPHFVTECVPIDMEEAEMAPMYFQKAFQDAEGLWATNKAVINTMKEMSHFKKVPHQLGTIYCKKLISNTL